MKLFVYKKSLSAVRYKISPIVKLINYLPGLYGYFTLKILQCALS